MHQGCSTTSETAVSRRRSMSSPPAVRASKRMHQINVSRAVPSGGFATRQRHERADWLGSRLHMRQDRRAQRGRPPLGSGTRSRLCTAVTRSSSVRRRARSLRLRCGHLEVPPPRTQAARSTRQGRRRRSPGALAASCRSRCLLEARAGRVKTAPPTSSPTPCGVGGAAPWLGPSLPA
jgi:hypothetical protein